MSPSMIPNRGRQHLHRGTLAMLALASAMLLGGCSIWPKALTFGSDPEQVPPPPAMAPVEPPVTQPAAAPAAVEAKSTVTVTPVAEPAPVEPAPAAVALPPAAPAPAPAPAQAPVTHKVPVVGTVHGYYVNAGLFAVPTNGSRVYDTLEHAGLPVFTEILETKNGQRTRVRVGPYPTKAKAQAAAKKVRALKLDANVIKY